MARASKRGIREALDFSSLAIASVKAGRPEDAVRHFAQAVACAPRDPGVRLNLARVLTRLGRADWAARELTTALSLKSVPAEAASMLAKLAETQPIYSPLRLNRVGLVSALEASGIDRQPLATLVFRLLTATNAAHVAEEPEAAAHTGGVPPEVHPLADVLAGVAAVPASAPDVASGLVGKRTHALLRDKLLLAALSSGVNTEHRVEILCVAIRETMVAELDDARWQDADLLALALAMVRQLELNEYVWPFVAEEPPAPDVDDVRKTLADALAGDASAGVRLVRIALARPIEDVAGEIQPEALAKVRPLVVRHWLERHALEASRYRSLTETLTVETFGMDVDRAEDDVSTRVAAQYEARPYPRWTSVRLPEPGSLRRALLSRYASDADLPETGYDVLIAGAGTGRHACQSAVGHGMDARVLAIDLSRASLLYGAGQAAALGVTNLSFSSGNLLDAAALGRQFDVVESVGVLHHMADPLAGWRALVDVLKPGGLMWIALYSATSRRNIARIRERADFPGVSPSDAAVRAFRADLLTEEPTDDEPWIGHSIDTWSLSGFRDLVVHEHERGFHLPEIKTFLDGSGLEFLGFTLNQSEVQGFLKAHPDEVWPGDLSTFDTYEQANPRLFDGMYSFWCRKAL